MVYTSFSVFFYKFQTFTFGKLLPSPIKGYFQLLCIASIDHIPGLLTFHGSFMYSDTLQLLGLLQNLPYHRFAIQL